MKPTTHLANHGFAQRALAIIAMLACLMLAAPGVFAVGYQVSSIETDAHGEQTVLAAFLSEPDVADLVLITITADSRRTMSVLRQQSGEYVLATDAFELPGDLVAVDVGRRLGRDIVVGFTQSSAYQIDPVTGKTTPIAAISTIYGAAIKDSVPHLDFFTDINGDSHDDLVLPGFNGFQIHTQRPDGTFTAAVNLSAPPIVEVSLNDYPWYQPRQKHLGDMTLDGKVDISVLMDNELHVFPQLDNGQFAATPLRISTGVPLEFGGMDELSVAMRDIDQSDNLSRALVKLKDLNGDDLTDMMVISVRSQGVFRKQTSYQIYQGIDYDGALGFSKEPVTTIESSGYQFELESIDLNNDDQIDMAISAVDIGLGKVLGALLTGSVKIDLNFYQMKTGGYPRKPDLKREVTATFDLSSGEFFYPSVLLTDASGDGLEDLLVQAGSDQLELYLGSGDDKLFARSPIVFDVAMPTDPDYVSVVDLNLDGKADIIMRHEPTSGAKKLVVMVSR